MRREQHWALVVVLLLVLPVVEGCSDREEPRPEGEWVWVSAEGGHLMDHITTALGEGLSLHLKDGSFTAMRSDNPVAEGTYMVSGEAVAARSGTVGPTLVFSSAPPTLNAAEWVIKSRADTLWLLTLMDDGFDHAFIRLR